MKEISLPDPWVDVPLPENDVDHEKRFEQAAGVFRSYSQGENSSGNLLRFQHWVHLQNSETSVDVFVYLQNKPFTQGWEATSVYFSAMNDNCAVSGSELRKLPLSTICSIYGTHFNKSLIWSTRRSALMNYGEVPELTAPLPKVGKRRGEAFYALVGMQFDYLEKKYPNENIAKKMKELNKDVPLSTVQRWIAKARSLNMLAAAQWVKK
jgi:hypothetical protein